MFLRALCCAIVLSVSAMAMGQQPAELNPKSSWMDGLEPTTLSFTSKFRSKYVFSNAADVYDRPVIQSDLFVQCKCGLTFDAWGSFPTRLSELDENFGTEVDFTLGWNGKLGDYNLSFGLGYYALEPVTHFGDIDFIVPYAEISRDFKIDDKLSLSPFFRLEVNFTPGGQVNGDALPRLGSRFGYKVNDTLTLSGQAFLLYDPGIFGGDVAWVGNIEGAALWKLGDHAVLEAPYLRYISPFNSVHDGRDPEFIFGFGITFNF